MSGIVKRFGPTLALDHVYLQIYSGRVLSVAGENGSGKSTLMKVLAGVHFADEGSMTLDGKPFAPKNPADARNCGVAMIHQELSICPHLSVRENVMLGNEKHRAGWIQEHTSDQLARAALEPLGLADLDLGRPAKQYPIGVQQLIEIARALASEAKIIILDEPTSSLSETDVVKLFAVLKELRSRGAAIVYISHFLNEMREISDDISILRDGQNATEGPMDQFTDHDIVTAMVGRSVDDLYPRSNRNAGEVLLTVDRLAGEKLPADASFSIHKGEVFGIAGLNGSGRSELLRTIFGLDAVKSGQVRVGSFSGRATPNQRWQEGIGFLSENRKEEGLAVKLSIEENLVMPKRPKAWVLERQEHESATEWVQKIGVKCRDTHQRINELSGGNQQKVAIARMLYAGVDVLLMDEPTRGIDVGSKAQIYQLIDELAQSGKAIVMVSSYLPELLGTCDRIAVMHRGKLSASRPSAEWSQASLIHEAVGASA